MLVNTYGSLHCYKPEVYSLTMQIQLISKSQGWYTLNVAMLNFHCKHKDSCHNHGNDTIHHCCSRGQWRQSNYSVKFEVKQGIVLMPLTSLHHFLIYALSFFGPTHVDWFIWISLRLFFLWKYQNDISIRKIVHLRSCEKQLLASSCLSVHLSIRLQGTTRLPLDGFFMKFYIRVFFESLYCKFPFH